MITSSCIMFGRAVVGCGAGVNSRKYCGGGNDVLEMMSTMAMAMVIRMVDVANDGGIWTCRK